jgi:integrase
VTWYEWGEGASRSPKPERVPEEYSDDEITARLNAAGPDERLLLHAFLCTGMRSGDVANLTYGDIRPFGV